MGNSNLIGQPADLDSMKKYQGFTIKHILKLKERLDLLANEDLSIDMDMFQLAMKTKEQETERLFGLFDLSNDQKIETLEFICALALISHASLKDKCSIIFGLYDFDKNRTMTRNELIILIKTVLTSLNAMTSKGECTIAEAEVMAEQILLRYDTNKDQSVSLKEFTSFVSKDPDIIRMLLSYGLISLEDMRFNFGLITETIPDADSDLEDEINKSKIRREERYENIKLGIEHALESKEQMVFLDDEDEPMDEPDEKLEARDSLAWYRQIKNCAPSDHNPRPGDSNPPAASLEIVHVYGFRSFDTRNNLKYFSTNSSDELIYHHGAIGICLDPLKNTQRFFLEHTDDITCLDVGDNYAVTGQMGRTPTIFVWDLSTCEVRAVLRGLFKIGVSNIAISNDQKKVVAIGMDDDQCIGIYDIDKAVAVRQSGKRDDSLIASGKGPRSEIFDVKFDRSDKTIVIACKGEVNFVTFDNQILKVLKGGWEPKICPIQSVISLGIVDNSVVTGTFKGSLIMWRGNRTTSRVDAHKGPVTAIHTRKREVGIITGGKDGFILFWDSTLKIIKKVNLYELTIKINNFKITAICENNTGSQFVIGTRGGEIIEFSENKAQKVMTGHFQGDLKGLCCHPSSDFFFTVGEDSLLMKWDLVKRTLVKSIKLEYQSKTLDISDDGKFLAVGCHNGNILIIEPNQMVQQSDYKDRDSEISYIKFSPDCELLLCAYSQPYCEIFIYNVPHHFKKSGIIGGFTEDIMSIDFGQYQNRIIMVSDWSLKLSFISLNDPLYQSIPNGESECRDVQWSTYRSVYGWHLMGIWPEITEGDDINAVDKAKTCSVLVSADDYSGIKLFRFPAYASKQSFNRYSGHSGHVSNVRFTNQDSYVISLGGREKSIIQWKFTNQESSLNEYENFKTEVTHQDLDFDDNESDIGIPMTTSLKRTDNKPYLQQIKNLSPIESEEEQLTIINVLPKQQLSISYVYGIRTQYQEKDVYNQVKYSYTGKIVYPSGGIVIVQDTKQELKLQVKPQSYFTRHTQDVISIAIHPKGLIMASGTASKKDELVEIMVWEVDSKQCLSIIEGFHYRGVSHLAFSPDGTLLLSIGMDDDNSIGLYDWQANRLLSTNKVDKSNVYDICWKSQNKFVTTGQKHLKFWSMQGRNLSSQFGNFNGSNYPYEPQTALTFAFNYEIVSGGMSGSLYLWRNDQIQYRTIQGVTGSGHSGKVTCLLSAKQNLFSAGVDGLIILWGLSQYQLQQLQVYQETVRLTGSLTPILGMDWRNENTVVVTKQGEMYEFVNSLPPRTQLIMKSHHSDQLTGLCLLPSSFQQPYNINQSGQSLPKQRMFLTCGRDKTLRQIDCVDKKIIKVILLPHELTALDCSPDGKFIVVGDIKGYIYLLNDNFDQMSKTATKFKEMKMTRDSNKLTYYVSQIRFSPNSKQIALGGAGGPSHIEVWDLQDDKLVNQNIINVGFTNSVNHIDWSRDSLYLIATSESFELKFISIFRYKEAPATQVKDVAWETMSCIFGYDVQGIYPYSRGNDIGSVWRSKNQQYLLSGDTFGDIRLFNYPVTFNRPVQVHRIYPGHKGVVQAIRTFPDESYAVSIGLEDRMTIIWQVESSVIPNAQNFMQQEEMDLAKIEENQRQLSLLNNVLILEKKVGLGKFGKVKVQEQFNQEEEEEQLDEEDLKASQNVFMKPWMASIKEPTNYYKDPINQEREPRVDINLEYAHGYRCHDCRSNVKYLKNGMVLFHTACLGVVLDITSNIQKFFTHHREDIVAMDLHPDGIRVATGDVSPQPSIYVWDSNTLLPLCLFKGQMSIGVASLSFSPMGDRLCAVSMDELHQMAIYQINTKSPLGGSLVAKELTGTNKITEIKWRTEHELISIGPFSLMIWTFNSHGIFGKPVNVSKDVCQVYTTMLINGDDVYIGDVLGNLQIWKNYNHVGSINRHSGLPLESIHATRDYLITGGRDTKFIIYELRTIQKETQSQLNTTFTFSLNESIKATYGNSLSIKSIQMFNDSKTVLVGTSGGEIWEVSTKDQKLNANTRFAYSKSLIKGHFSSSKTSINEIWGLTFNPQEQDIYYTCGDDITIRAWSISTKRMLASNRTNLDSNQNEIKSDDKGENSDSVKGRSIAVSPDGMWVVVGFKDGTVRIFDKDLKQKQVNRIAKEWISDLKFNPDGNQIAFGSHDNSIYLYTFPEMKQIGKPLRKHSEFIKNIDYSCDGKYIHSTCGGFDLLYWDLENLKQLPNGANLLKNEKWHTWTSLLGWPVQGIWGEDSDGNDVNCCERSHFNFSGKDQAPDNYYLLAVGNDNNEVKIHRYGYPCVQRNTQAVVGRGHSSPVTSVSFSADDQYLISVGGEDLTILQWKIIKK